MKIIRLALVLCTIVPQWIYAQTRVMEKGGSSNLSNKKMASGKRTFLSGEKEAGIAFYPYSDLMRYAEAASLYARSNQLNTRYAFLINMGMKSSSYRFFVVDLKHHCMVKSGLVSHGSGFEAFTLNHKYSNLPGSKCTSLGKYRIGKSYNGFFGLAFTMYGLDKTNSMALDRKVVLHAMHCIPDEPNGQPICQSEGCPAVSDQFIIYLKNIIENSREPILLWIFDSTHFPSAKEDGRKVRPKSKTVKAK